MQRYTLNKYLKRTKLDEMDFLGNKNLYFSEPLILHDFFLHITRWDSNHLGMRVEPI
jgi:hypothetical protein